MQRPTEAKDASRPFCPNIAWMGLAMMVSTRLWLAGVVQEHRDHHLADALLGQVRRCAKLVHTPLVLTDGWVAYPASIRRAFRIKVKTTPGGGRAQVNTGLQRAASPLPEREVVWGTKSDEAPSPNLPLRVGEWGNRPEKAPCQIGGMLVCLIKGIYYFLSVPLANRRKTLTGVTPHMGKDTSDFRKGQVEMHYGNSIPADRKLFSKESEI